MKTGLIIVFQKRQELLPKEQLIALFKRDDSIKFCLLNKQNDDYIMDYFAFIADQCDNVSIVNIRKNQANISAVRAGARFMQNAFNLSFLGHIIETNKTDIISMIETFIDHNDEIVNKHLETLRAKKNKPTFIQKLLSINEFLKKNEFELNGSNLNIIS